MTNTRLKERDGTGRYRKSGLLDFLQLYSIEFYFLELC